MNSMSFLQQLPVIPQIPGQPAFYAPDKIPKGAVIAFMPVVILPEAAHLNCNDEQAKLQNQRYQANVDPFPLGVQPAAIPQGFSLNSIFSTETRKDQCMCPCSCTQNLPDRLQKKRDIPTDVEEEQSKAQAKQETYDGETPSPTN